MDFVFKGLSFFSGRTRDSKKPTTAAPGRNAYVKASEDLKRSVEELNRATQRLQKSFRQRQSALNDLVSVVGRVEARRSPPAAPSRLRGRPRPAVGRIEKKPPAVGEAQLFEIYREACMNFIETDKHYYFKLRNHSDFLCALYQRHMGNLRYYDHEFRRLKNPEEFRFTEFEAYVANRVIQSVGKMGREKFVREGHQRLYHRLCSELLSEKAGS